MKKNNTLYLFFILGVVQTNALGIAQEKPRLKTVNTAKRIGALEERLQKLARQNKARVLKQNHAEDYSVMKDRVDDIVRKTYDKILKIIKSMDIKRNRSLFTDLKDYTKRLHTLMHISSQTKDTFTDLLDKMALLKEVAKKAALKEIAQEKRILQPKHFKKPFQNNLSNEISSKALDNDTHISNDSLIDESDLRALLDLFDSSPVMQQQQGKADDRFASDDQNDKSPTNTADTEENLLNSIDSDAFYQDEDGPGNQNTNYRSEENINRSSEHLLKDGQLVQEEKQNDDDRQNFEEDLSSNTSQSDSTEKVNDNTSQQNFSENNENGEETEQLSNVNNSPSNSTQESKSWTVKGVVKKAAPYVAAGLFATLAKYYNNFYNQ